MKQLSEFQQTFLASLLIFGLFSGFSAAADTIKTAATENNKTSENIQTDFDALLKESGLSFKSTKGFKEIAVEPEYVLPYEKAHSQ